MPTLLAGKLEVRKAGVSARFEQLRANEEEFNRIFVENLDLIAGQLKGVSGRDRVCLIKR